MSGADVTFDGFLGGRLTAAQPKRGFRAGHDTVLIAAAVPASLGDRVLELGAGVGIASLCLAARVPSVAIVGIEIDPALVALANDNAASNGFAGCVHFDIGDAAKAAAAAPFDHVFFNPPFHPATGQESPDAGRARAMQDCANLPETWMRAALAAVKPDGTVTAIIRADRADAVIEAAGDNAAVLFPLFPRASEPPKRAIVQIVKDGRKMLRTTAGLVLHDAAGRNTDAAEAVLRHGEALRLDGPPA